MNHIAPDFFDFHVLSVNIVHSHHCFIDEAPEDMFLDDFDLFFSHPRLAYSFKTIKALLKTNNLYTYNAYKTYNAYNINLNQGIKMSLEKLFTGSATARILDVLWEYQDIDLTLTDIADEAGIHYTTLMKALPVLEELGMVTMTRQVGNAKLYQIKEEDIVVKRLVKFLNALNIRIAECEVAKQGMPLHNKEMILA